MKTLQVLLSRHVTFGTAKVHCSSMSPHYHCIGWDINSANLAEACERAAVLDIQIQDALRPQLIKMKPRPSIYCPDFIAANQEDRADNILKGNQHIQGL